MLGHRTDALVLAKGHGEETLVAAFPAPLALAEQNLGDLRALDLQRWLRTTSAAPSRRLR